MSSAPASGGGQHPRGGAGRQPRGRASAVVFDLGGVLIDFDPRHLYRKLFTDPAEMEGFLATICTEDWHRAHNLGDGIADSCRRLARQHPGHRDLIMAWAERGEEMIAGALQQTVQVLAELRAAGVPCYALSNMEPEVFPIRHARFEFMTWFDGVVISGYERVAKPDRRLYEIMLSRYRLDPRATVFVDDSPVNVEAARELGMLAVHFTSAGQLRHDLRARGLPVAVTGTAARLSSPRAPSTGPPRPGRRS